jgi:hypothetical protein
MKLKDISMFRYFTLILIIILYTNLGFAQENNIIKLSLLVGIGSSQASGEKIERVDSPLSFFVQSDYIYNRKISLFGEYMTTVGTYSAINTEVIGGKYYFSGIPAYKIPDYELDPNSMYFIQKGFSFYAGLGLGMVNINFLRRVKNELDLIASGAILSLKVGAEYPLINNFGLKSELTKSFKIPDEIQYNNLYVTLGLYFIFD